jgi:hypothetical protein
MSIFFNEHMIARAAHTGWHYLVNLRRVYNLLTSYLHGEHTQSWIQNIAHYQDSNHDISTLHCHSACKGNSTCCISDAKFFQSPTLHDKSKHSLPFIKFLNLLQKMFTIFEEENVPLSEHAKVKKNSPKCSISYFLLEFHSCISN